MNAGRDYSTATASIISQAVAGQIVLHGAILPARGYHPIWRCGHDHHDESSALACAAFELAKRKGDI